MTVTLTWKLRLCFCFCFFLFARTNLLCRRFNTMFKACESQTLSFFLCVLLWYCLMVQLFCWCLPRVTISVWNTYLGILSTVVLQICCLSWDSQASTFWYTTIMSVLLTGCQRATVFLFNVFCSWTSNVRGALHVIFLFFVYLLFCLCLCMCGLCAFCVWTLVVWFKINGWMDGLRNF